MRRQDGMKRWTVQSEGRHEGIWTETSKTVRLRLEILFSRMFVSHIFLSVLTQSTFQEKPLRSGRSAQEWGMRVRLLLGPAGSGKTFRCLTEIREALSASPDGPALVLVAPKQTTYQLERRFLEDSSVPGYTRLHILSFERLAQFVFARLGKASPDMLDAEGRVMVLRGLLAKKRNDLKLFRASARLTGFAQQLSTVLGELQRHQQTPETLRELAGRIRDNEGLTCKLQDLATLLKDYLGWLEAHGLQDDDCLLGAATEALLSPKSKVQSPKSGTERGCGSRSGHERVEGRGIARRGLKSEATATEAAALRIGSLWVDGFAELSPHELELLAALLPHCENATLTFCLDRAPTGKLSWLSSWSVVRKAFEDCRQRLAAVPGADIVVDVAPRHPTITRFLNNPVLAHLERYWSEPRAYDGPLSYEISGAGGDKTASSPLPSPPEEERERIILVGAVAASPQPSPHVEREKTLPAATGGVAPLSPAPLATSLDDMEQTASSPLPSPPKEEGERTNLEGAVAASPQPSPRVEREKTRPSDLGLRTFPLRIVTCLNPDAEVTLAAREILRHVRGGGRFRDVTVLVRKLESYHEPLQRILSRYGIPFFLDRRESVSHHPLAELTRSALRTVVMQWVRHEDWFAALKTGLVPVEEADIDRLENEALARGWKGAVWQKPIVVAEEPELTAWLADLHHRLLPPFQRLALALAVVQNKPTGPQLAAALRDFWTTLQVEERLREWATAEISSDQYRVPTSVHTTVWEQLNLWLENVELAFFSEPLGLREWLPILDAGLAGLTVGVIPPALDQVLIGAVDRSRNPRIQLALVLGLNEGVFPAAPETSLLLTDNDRLELEKQAVPIGATARQQLSRERYYAYIACTRARERVVLTHALHDSSGLPLAPSPFLAQVRAAFPVAQARGRSRDCRLARERARQRTDRDGPVSPKPKVRRCSPKSKVQSPKSGRDGSQSTVYSLQSTVYSLQPKALQATAHRRKPTGDRRQAMRSTHCCDCRRWLPLSSSSGASIRLPTSCSRLSQRRGFMARCCTPRSAAWSNTRPARSSSLFTRDCELKNARVSSLT